LPENLTLDDLDRVSDFITEHYFSGALDPYLTVVFTNNSGYCGPNKVDDPDKYAEVFRAHRVQPKKHLLPATGERCVFSGLAASAWVHRQHLPLFSGAQVMNFRPAGQTAVPIAASYLVALQFLPMAARRAEGQLLAVHTDDPKLTIAFARRYLDDNRRILSLALPKRRAAVHTGYDREIPMWDAKKKQYKMADVKGPRSLVIADLTEIAANAAPTDTRPYPVAMTVYLLSNSGQGPSLEIFPIPSGVVSFVRNAAQAQTANGWRAVAERFRPVQEAEDESKGTRKRKAASRSAAIRGRPGWSRNPAFEDLCRIFEAGFVDNNAANRWLRQYVLGRIENRTGDVRYENTRARLWALAELFVQEVLGMRKGRIEAIKQFGDKVANWINEKRDRTLYRALAYDSPWELRQRLLRAQRDGMPLGLDEYATVWLHEDDSRADESLVRDLVCIRVVEQLYELKYFESHPEDRLETTNDGGLTPANKEEV
jgi:CRISPR-associated protein Cst1